MANPFDPTAFNLAQHVLQAGRATPDKVALAILTLTRAERWSYARLTQAILGCGGWLLAQGLEPGDRVLIRLGNCPAYPVLYLGAMAAGLVPIATSPLLTAPEIAQMAAQVTPKLVVYAPEITLPEGYALAQADLPLWQSHPPCQFHQGPADREAYIVFTSGTSGRPLAVRHAHRAILGRRMMHQGWEGLSASDRLLHSGAFNWTYTMGTGLLDPWSLGATAMIAAPSVPLEQLGLVLKRHDATIFATVPTVLRRLLRAPLPALPKLRHVLCAGEALPASLRAEWAAKSGQDVIEALGTSEVSTFLSGSPSRPAPAGASGYAQPGRKIAVLSETGAPLACGEIGRLAISTDDPGLMLSYEGQPPPAGPWFATGDLVHQNAEGAIFYHGRADEMLNAGGIRTSPREIEAALAGLPGVTELAVTEVEVAPGTKVIACFYAGSSLSDCTANEIAAQSLARYKCPRLWQRVEAIPRGPTGKILRRQLAALYKRPDHEF